MSQFVAIDLVLGFCAFFFCAGVVLGGAAVGLWIYWPLITQTLFPGAML